MDSLLANYASSDDENDQGSQELREAAAIPTAASKPLAGNSLQLPPTKPASSSSLLSSLPPPRVPSLHSSSSSFSPFSSLPQPKTHYSSNYDSNSVQVRSKDIKGGVSSDDIVSSGPIMVKGSILSTLPPSKISSSTSPFLSPLPAPKLNLRDPMQASMNQNPKKIVQIKPKYDPSMLKDGDSDDDDEYEKKRKEIKDLSSASLKSISSILPAPRNVSLGSALSATSGVSRRSVVKSDAPASNGQGLVSEPESGGFGSYEVNDGSFVNPPVEIGADGAANDGFWGSTGASAYDPSTEGTTYPGYPSGSNSDDWYSGYEVPPDYGTCVVPAENASYGGSWSDGSPLFPAPEASGMPRFKGKRGRGEVPIEIVEVKQDELMKNRPREDQAKLTGIAFGPSYQPVSSGKGKPTKLHKRKHQIGSLYFDMRQKESELAERRSRGLLTKAQTHGKYGW